MGASLLGSGCELFDNNDPVPAFLIINEVDVEPLNTIDPNTFNFRDVWLFVDGQEYGVWTLPARIPIDASTEVQEILISPGIRANGVSGTARRYPFFDFYKVEQVLEPEVRYEIKPTFKYLDGVEVAFEEGFESRNIFSVDIDGDLTTTVLRTDMSARSGDYSGMIKLPGDTDIMQVRTQFQYDASQLDGPHAYLELDYKGDVPLLVGYIALGDFTFGELKVLVIESNEWKKMYIDLSAELTDPSIDDYEIQLAASIADLVAVEGTIFIDNVRLLHF